MDGWTDGWVSKILRMTIKENTFSEGMMLY